MSSYYSVTLDCGHSFAEQRPDDIADPVEGENRACGAFEHYPRQYPARYQELSREEFEERLRMR
jgi:hypothetical protein